MARKSAEERAKQELEGLDEKQRLKVVAKIISESTSKTETINRQIKDLDKARDRIEGFLAGKVVPENTLISWRERCFEICEGIDRLRDEMRVILLEIGDFPKGSNWDKAVKEILVKAAPEDDE